MSKLLLAKNNTAPETPPGGVLAFYAKNDGKIYTKDDTGTEQEVSGGGTSSSAAANLLINGSFAVWQRGTSLASLSEPAYSADRWYVLAENAAINAARTDGSSQRYAARLTQANATAQRLGLAQIIEGVNCRHLRGQKATLSGRARLSASGNVRFAILSWTGSEDGDDTTAPNPHFSSSAKDIVASWGSTSYTAGSFFASSNLVVERVGSVACDGNWADFSVTTSAAMSASLNNVFVVVWSEAALAQSTTLDLEALQLEAGESASTFQQRGVSEELALCQRYYHQVGGMANYQYGIGFPNSASAAYVPIRLVSPLRTTPACSFSALEDFVLLGFGNASIAPDAMSFGVVSKLDVRIDITSTSMTPLSGGILQGTGTTSSKMIFNAEL